MADLSNPAIARRLDSFKSVLADRTGLTNCKVTGQVFQAFNSGGELALVAMLDDVVSAVPVQLLNSDYRIAINYFGIPAGAAAE